jgi:5'-3' exonuclease
MMNHGARPQLLLIDGSSYIFRAYFALPPQASSSGLPTNAVYGFTQMMLKLLRQHQPDYMAVALDATRKTFRNELFPGYKSKRLQPPPELVPQLPYVRKVLDVLNILALELGAYEADDLIATLCKTMANEECDITIVSTDKDLMQLVGKGVKLRDGSRERWIGVDEVKAKFGVAPEKLVDVVGLMGDAVDNIPGVKGIGRKTAIALIQEFRSLENLFDHLDQIDNMELRGAARIRKALAEEKTAAFLSRHLATVRSDVPLDIRLEELRCRAPDREKMRTLFTELTFTNLLKILDNEFWRDSSRDV